MGNTRRNARGKAKGPTRSPPTLNTAVKEKSKPSRSAPKRERVTEVDTEDEDTPGAELFAHVQKGDLLAVAAPLALRKRSAEHLDGESEEESARTDAPAALKGTSRPKRIKQTKPSGTSARVIVDQKVDEKRSLTRKTQATTTEKKEKLQEDGRVQLPEDGATSEKQAAANVQDTALQGKRARITVPKKGKNETGDAKESTKRTLGTRRQQHQSPSPAGDEITGAGSGDDHVSVEEGKSSDSEEDHAEAFLKGFDSSDSDDPSGDEGFKAGQQVPRIPNTEGVADGSAKGTENNREHQQSGVLYIGRIPHGFYENEMRAYFSQFGDLTHLRLARNRRTGNSKHYAFLEFASPAVADIAARTMNNYLLFGHILKCHVIPTEQIPPNLWRGEGKKIRPVPWNTIERNKVAKPKPRSVWTKKIEVVTKSRQQKAEQLKAIGYDFEMPVLKEVDAVGRRGGPVPAAEGVENDVSGSGATSKIFKEVSILAKAKEQPPKQGDQKKGIKKASKAKGTSQKAGS